MALNIPGSLMYPQWGQQVGENISDGLQQRRMAQERNRLASLLPKAFGGDQEAIAGAAAIDPNLGYRLYAGNQERAAAQTKFDREDAQLREKQFATDLTGALGGVYSAPPEQRAQAWTQVLGRLSSKYSPEELDDLSPEWSDAFGSEIAAGLGAYSKEHADILSRYGAIPTPNDGKPVTLSKGAILVDPVTGRQIAQGPEDVADNFRTVGRSLIDIRDPRNPLYTDPTAKTGFAVTLPDGTEVQYGDISGSKKNYDAAIERMVGAENWMTRIDDIESMFNPDLFRVPAKVENLFNTGKDYLGMDLSESELKQLDEATQMKAALVDNLSAYVKDISGAAATDAERKFLSLAQPSINDSPAVLKAKLKRARRAGEMVVERERKRTGQTSKAPTGGGDSGGWSITPVN